MLKDILAAKVQGMSAEADAAVEGEACREDAVEPDEPEFEAHPEDEDGKADVEAGRLFRMCTCC